jgi:hypothetical protein
LFPSYPYLPKFHYYLHLLTFPKTHLYHSYPHYQHLHSFPSFPILLSYPMSRLFHFLPSYHSFPSCLNFLKTLSYLTFLPFLSFPTFLPFHLTPSYLSFRAFHSFPKFPYYPKYRSSQHHLCRKSHKFDLKYLTYHLYPYLTLHRYRKRGNQNHHRLKMLYSWIFIFMIVLKRKNQTY